MKNLSLAYRLLFISISTCGQTIFNYSTAWKYLDNGTDQKTAWRNSSFDDAKWKSGNAPLGYGTSPLPTTIVSFGSSSTKKYITTYFRKSFTVANLSSINQFILKMKIDDGAVIYLNGNQIHRVNMPSTFSSKTKALVEVVQHTSESSVTLPKSYFVENQNIIAVEIHQYSTSGPDIYFDMQLEAVATTNLPPVANAGADQSHYLPINFITLSGTGSDADGNVQSYQWSQVAGPVATSITYTNTASTPVTGLTSAGTYTFKLTVTDNLGAKGEDLVNIQVAEPTGGPITLITWEDTWKYLDNGVDQGTTWRNSSFNDGSWVSGKAELGYGDAPNTTLSFGTNSSAKYITYYFRKILNFNNPSAYTTVLMNVRRDDGIIVYINGTEVYRNNLPAGTVSYSTLAALASDDGASILSANIPISAFTAGNNVVAVEIHQNAINSSDITFDMEMVAKDASSPAILTRGPYIQMVNGNSASIRWRTDVATDSKIELGTTHGTYTLSAVDPLATTEHEVRINGLSPDTKYFYRFGSSSSILQNGTSNFFITAPPPSSTRKIRVAVFGDCGRNDNTYQTSTLSSYLNYVGNNPAELMLLLGDNAYNNGTDVEYQSNFFNVYSSSILKNHALFPAPGNHDYANTQARQIDKNVPYYQNFSMPTTAECGGVASGTECYYSFDWGNIHFLSLDSYGLETANNLRLYNTNSPQVNWIKQDLAANTKKWTVAYWHHPPYTMGSHNSDTENDLVQFRQNFISILENLGVDLILCGHSHDYERSYLLKGYYTNEGSFNTLTHTASSSSGKYDGSTHSCPYQTTSLKENHGTVYVVSGSAGASGSVQAGYPHNALPFAVNDGGMFYFEVEDNRLDAKFIRRNGTIFDQFTIMKDAGKNTSYNITTGQNITLTASWNGNYSWSNGATTKSITVNPTVNSIYTCTDGITNCITDQFTVNISSAGITYLDLTQTSSISLYPNPARRGTTIKIHTGSLTQQLFDIIDISGRKIKTVSGKAGFLLNTEFMKPGIYIMKNSSTVKNPIIIRFIISD